MPNMPSPAPVTRQCKNIIPVRTVYSHSLTYTVRHVSSHPTNIFPSLHPPLTHCFVVRRPGRSSNSASRSEVRQIPPFSRICARLFDRLGAGLGSLLELLAYDTESDVQYMFTCPRDQDAQVTDTAARPGLRPTIGWSLIDLRAHHSVQRLWIPCKKRCSALRSPFPSISRLRPERLAK